jgi:ABC-type sugar transport system substrate-binding protein
MISFTKSMAMLAACAFAASSLLISGTASADEKKITVGFVQVGAESAWRTANSKSVTDEAAKRGIDLKFADGQQKQENQIKAVRAFIAQHVDVIVLAPVVEPGFEPVLTEAKRAKIPVILSDRRAKLSNDSLYVTFIGSDFIEEGRLAAKFLVDKTGGKAKIAELQGTPGSAPANDRMKGFKEVIADKPEMEIIMSQTGDFTRAKGKEVMEAFLKSPKGKEINALFAHNDDMAIGAIQAIEAAGLKPGKDIIIVSIDGVKSAFEAMADGKLNCTVECNPLIGPQLFDAVEAIVAGKPVEKRVAVKEGVFTEDQAKAELPNRKY